MKKILIVLSCALVGIVSLWFLYDAIFSIQCAQLGGKTVFLDRADEILGDPAGFCEMPSKV